MGRTDTFECYVDKDGDCWNWIGYCCQSTGYGRYRQRAAHRTAYERAKGPIPRGMLVCHSCDNRACMNPDHLWIGSPGDNMKDMTAKGRGRPGVNKDRRGALNPNAKLTEDDVRAIRSARGTAKEIASLFGVSAGTISGIRAKRKWAGVQT